MIAGESVQHAGEQERRAGGDVDDVKHMDTPMAGRTDGRTDDRSVQSGK
jgi:hypothetical protein